MHPQIITNIIIIIKYWYLKFTIKIDMIIKK